MSGPERLAKSDRSAHERRPGDDAVPALPTGPLRMGRQASLLNRIPAAMMETIEGWRDDAELTRLREALLAQSDSKGFYDRYAEAIAALHLQQAGVLSRFEVPAPNGRLCDFQIRLGDDDVFVHIKRLKTPDNADDVPPIAARLRYLERINRPYIVSIRWRDDLSDAQMQHLVREAAQFIQHARIGEEKVVRDEGGELGGLRIVAPWDGTHITLATESANGFVDDTPRFAKLIRKAAKQFMPGAINVVLIASERGNGYGDFESALLGTHIERWDAFPPRGKRIAHGRAADGFWHGRRYSDFQAAGVFRITPEQMAFDCRLWVRAESRLSTDVMRRLMRLLDTRPR